MGNQLLDGQSIIYKVFCDAAEGLVVDLSGEKIKFNHKKAFQGARDYVEDLYEEGIGEEITEEQVAVLSHIAVANNAWFIIDGSING